MLLYTRSYTERQMGILNGAIPISYLRGRHAAADVIGTSGYVDASGGTSGSGTFTPSGAGTGSGSGSGSGSGTGTNSGSGTQSGSGSGSTMASPFIATLDGQTYDLTIPDQVAAFTTRMREKAVGDLQRSAENGLGTLLFNVGEVLWGSGVNFEQEFKPLKTWQYHAFTILGMRSTTLWTLPIVLRMVVHVLIMLGVYGFLALGIVAGIKKLRGR